MTVGLDMFAERGYHACGVKDLAEAAGVLKGSFYNYFESKEQLAVEVLGVYLAETRLDMLSDEGLAPLVRIRAHFEHVASVYEERGYERGCLMNKFANEMTTAPLIDRDLAAVTREWARLLSAAVRAGQEDGGIGDVGDPDRIARFLLSAWNGAVTFMRVAASRAPLDDFFAVAFERIIPPGTGTAQAGA